MSRKPGPSLSGAQVLDAAIVVVCAEGPSALGTARVAAQLGIRAPSLYHHVASTEDLRRRVAVEGWRRLTEALAALPGEGAPEVRLRAMASAYRAFARGSPGLYRLMSDEPFDPTDPTLLALTAAVLAALGPGYDLHALRGLRAGLHGFVALELAGQLRLGVSVDESWAWWVDAMVRAVRGQEEWQA